MTTNKNIMLIKVNGDKKTKRALFNAVLAITLPEVKGSVHIDIVFNVYKDVSIKNIEWQSRSNSVEGIVNKTLTQPGCSAVR